MGSKALGDIQRLLQSLNTKISTLDAPGTRGPRGPARAARQGANWDCTQCAEGVDNFADRTRCFKCGGAKPRPAQGQQGQPNQTQPHPPRAPRARSRQPRAPSQQPQQGQAAKADPMDTSDDSSAIASELSTARSLYEWARKLPQPARDRELPEAKKRLDMAEAEDKRRKPPAERLQSALSRVDHRQRQAQAARDALAEARAALEVLTAECQNQEALLAKDQEELRVAQGLHAAWGPQARDAQGRPPTGAGASGEVGTTQGMSPQQADLLSRLQAHLPQDSSAPDILRELAASLGAPLSHGIAPQSASLPSPSLEAQGQEGQSGAKKLVRKARIAEAASPYSRPPSATPDRRLKEATQGEEEEELIAVSTAEDATPDQRPGMA